MTAPVEVRVHGHDGTRLRTLAWPRRQAHGRIVIVHGLGEHAGRYAEVARALGEAGWSVAAFDLRGHGDSEGARGVLRSFDRHLDDLQAVLDVAGERLAGPERTVLLGHSMGGLVVIRHLQVAGARPAAAILSAPWLDTAAPVPRWKRAAASVLRRLAPDLTLAQGVRAEWLTRDPERARAWREDPRVHDRISTRLWDGVRDAQKRARGTPLDPGLPLLVLVPGDDPLVSADATEAWVARCAGPQTRVARLAGGRHEPFHDLDRVGVLGLVVEWLAGLAGAERGPPERVSFPDRRQPRADRPTGDGDLHRNGTRQPT
jgi:alpha-beta hydrolase superfamily lysophospholipase